MALAHINLSVKQYFNFMCQNDFERRIFHDSYREFQKKSKIFSQNQQAHTFSQMLQLNEKAGSLHQKLQYSVMPSIVALEGKIPVLGDLDGNALRFDWAELHILSSDLLNKAAHVVSLTYTSPKLALHEIIGDLLVLSYDKTNGSGETIMVKINENLMVNYQESNNLVYS